MTLEKEITDASQQQQKRRWSDAVRSPGLWSVMIVVIVAWLGLWYLNSIGGGSALREHWGWAAAVPLVLLHAVVAVSPFPGETVALGNSMIFGFQLGVLCNWSGWMLAAMIQYAIVRRAASDLHLHETAAWQRTPRWLRRFPMDHPLFLIMARWMPFGGHVVNIAAGGSSVPVTRHAWCAAISILPVAVLFAAIGSGAAELIWPTPLQVLPPSPRLPSLHRDL